LTWFGAFAYSPDHLTHSGGVDGLRRPHVVAAVRLGVVKSPRGQRLKPEDFYDNSFIQKLDASGFINSLYAH
jgi:hypothetical protein